ncbi:hypothetical protein GI374_02540 [Paracoccus sp. S-4012]|uniref:hypothetical protein n=1 Tax=Paracoccus sp. S-4012 TaxID=2665648 RepID=UPI0012B0CCD4|nr:hypothetical protein [Paracoccus sp. S-4012]MRX49339.1 hypothetical protein [Paracoccus sp. S-4012]
MRPLLAFFAFLAAPAFAVTGPVADGCTPEALQQRYNEGYIQGVEDIQAQLADATAVMQSQVQAQLDAQLGHLHARNEADLATSMREAQERALRDAVNTPMPRILTEGAASTTLPMPAPAAQAPDLPEDPSQLAPGSRLVIDNAERLPPALYAELMAYLKS